MRHCCAENVFGYSFWNASRRSYLDDTPGQRWDIPRHMLEAGLLDDLDRIATDLARTRSRRP